MILRVSTVRGDVRVALQCSGRPSAFHSTREGGHWRYLISRFGQHNRLHGSRSCRQRLPGNPETTLSLRVPMGLWPTQRNENHLRRRPRESGDPAPVDSRFRGNDVIFERATMGQRPMETPQDNIQKGFSAASKVPCFRPC